ncbi:hypothetical protein L210DRAFT_3654514 [Boletus edulis BED1]|uniref:Uncharacterized protein n=1 Tax=Boletus edulis BED1 TaxID=1328754 RepID=A0AAD4BDD6_BOLED|nr:hypothetical protein L210DRAFT_3654514 [Boletus edulis BED1]
MPGHRFIGQWDEPIMMSPPQSDSLPVRIPRPSREREQVFGYILRSDWINDFGQRHNVDPQGLKNEFGLIIDSVELIRDELKKDGEFALVRYLSNGHPDEVAQIYVARNFLRPMRGSTTLALIRAKVEKLKKFLDTTDEPQWMNL